jgi:tellurite resistance protein
VKAAAAAPSALKFLFPGWYAAVMGLSGLALAWHRASPLMGEAATAAALGTGVLAAAVFAALVVGGVLRWRRHREAWAEDFRHPVRHTFVAAMPIALLLLSTLAVALGLRGPLVEAAWWVASLAQLAVTLWVLGRWWRGNQAGGLQWASATPALFIPIVGNVLVPLAGVPLGAPAWSAAQLGVGLMFWPVVAVLLVVRIAVQGMWTERLLPANFIFVAPPAVVGSAMLQFGAPPLVAWGLWGVALFCLLWAATLLKRLATLPFGLPHWGMSFPLAAFAALTLRLGLEAPAGAAGPMTAFGVAVLALASLVIAALLLATLRGLRDGSLLAPEPVAAVVPASAA